MLNNFILKNYLFRATNIIKKSYKSRYVYSGYGITFDGAGSWSFGNGFAKNVILFGNDNNSSSHTNNLKASFFVLDKGPTDDTNDSIGTAAKKFSINFVNANAKFCVSLYCHGDDSHLFVNGKESISLRQIIKISTFQLNFA